MNLGELITTLEAADPTQTVHHGFTNPHSYRGDYMDLAFEPATDVTVAAMLADARSALGTTYEGWKGGDFTMSEHTWCWLSQEGDASGETISALLLKLMLRPEPAVSAPVQPPATRADALRLAANYVRGVSADRRFDNASVSTALCVVSDELWQMAVEADGSRVADEEQPATEADVDTVANRAAEVITSMGAEIRALKSQRDRYRSAWCSARERAQAHAEGTLRHVADRDFWKGQCKTAQEQPAIEAPTVAPAANASRTVVLLATRCDACPHTLNWHRNDVGCTVTLCVCGRFQMPADEGRPS